MGEEEKNLREIGLCAEHGVAAGGWRRAAEERSCAEIILVLAHKLHSKGGKKESREERRASASTALAAGGSGWPPTRIASLPPSRGSVLLPGMQLAGSSRPKRISQVKRVPPAQPCPGTEIPAPIWRLGLRTAPGRPRCLLPGGKSGIRVP